MCFSAQADVVAGLVVGGIGVGALRQVHRRRDLPLASLPALFAGHELVEALVWLDLTGRAPATTGRVPCGCTCSSPTWSCPCSSPPLSCCRGGRRAAQMVERFTVLGASVAAIYLLAMVRGPIGVAIEGHSLNYDTAVNAGGPLAVVYVAACCARSSSRVGGPSPSSAWPMWSQWPS